MKLLKFALFACWLSAVSMAMQLGMRAEARHKGGHAVPGRTKQRFAHRQAVLSSREPCPDSQPHPIHHLMRPDPDQ